ncbi:hypothetical protein ZHAS_00008132 [Anopheles sinensis]|uniref:Uncharacterized protein n=1 Tax=Anopheles sinensis TaxID=74873 RepID=A0A084VRM7_ANOSI|nr:hypothetical protein ZHAS_00008132 [Anopheles sinensis]
MPQTNPRRSIGSSTINTLCQASPDLPGTGGDAYKQGGREVSPLKVAERKKAKMKHHEPRSAVRESVQLAKTPEKNRNPTPASMTSPDDNTPYDIEQA